MMEQKDYKRILLFTFIILLAATIILSGMLASYGFEVLSQGITFTTFFFGILAIISYRGELWSLIRKKASLKRRKFGKRHVRSWLSFKIQLKLKPAFLRTTFLSDSMVIFLKKNKLKSLVWIFGTSLYFAFLIWVFPNVSFDEFMFFVLLAYIPISLKLKLDSRYPIGLAIVLLLSCAVELASGFENYANRLATYAYYFLVVGVALMFIEYLREPKKD
jgi:hypothetical protein